MKFFVVYTVPYYKHVVCHALHFTSRPEFEQFVRENVGIYPDMVEVPLSCVMKTYPKRILNVNFGRANWPYPFPIK